MWNYIINFRDLIPLKYLIKEVIESLGIDSEKLEFLSISSVVSIRKITAP